MQSQAVLTLSVLMFATSLTAQPTIRLKNRAIHTSESATMTSDAFATYAVDASQRIHLILQFATAPTADTVHQLEERGAKVISYIPTNSLMISVDPAMPLDGLGQIYSGPMDPADKMSALLLDEPATAMAMVEFHADVDMAQARALVQSGGVLVRDSADVAGNHLMVSASLEQLNWLTRQDAVAYIFPVSSDLSQGLPSTACAGALTAFGAIAQYTATAGNGWDGTGLGSAALTFSWGAGTAQLPTDAARAEVLRAFGEWSKVAAVTFSETSSNSAPRNVNVLFGKLDHGDGYPFDGRGGVLAHTFYPAPPNPEPLAGDMHFDDDEHWQIGANTDLFSVALHEAGHALGLGHSDNPKSVMYPYYKQVGGLTADDVAAIRTLYAAPGASAPSTPLTLTINSTPSSTTTDTVTVTGAANGGTGTLTVQANTTQGWSNTTSANSFQFAVPLSVGSNTITITAADGASSQTKTVTVTRQQNTTAAAVVAVRITDPATIINYTTRASSISISGTASHPMGIRAVTWTNANLGAGSATGTSSWNTGSLSLSNGSNTITITATATDGTTGSATIVIAKDSSQTPDATAPTLKITSPATAVTATTSSTIVLQGTASDNTNVQRITWETAAGDTGSATGTAAWQTAAIPLYTGYNTIVVRAYDGAGNMSWRSIQVTRR